MVSPKLKFLLSMLIFGSIGIFVRYIDLPANQIVFMRCLIGSLFLILMGLISGKIKKDRLFPLMKKWKMILVAGTFLGLNWLCLYEAFKSVPVSIAVIIYYLAPIIVVVLAPILLKESFTIKKFFSVILAVIGLILIVGIKNENHINSIGLIYSVFSAIFYAGLVISNQKLKELDGLIVTIAQIGIGAIIMGVYTLATFNGFKNIGLRGWIFLGILCIVHTGIACYLYFSSQSQLKGQEVAILSYLDPASALLFSSFFLNEVLTVKQWIGIVIILLSTFILEFKIKNKRRV